MPSALPSAPRASATPASAIALITASLRSNGNGDGFAAWLITRFDAVAVSRSSHHTLALASTFSPLPLPYGPFEDTVISQAITSPNAYTDPAVRAWSATVSATPAVVILTPQYNWGYPGQLKNLLDHVYHEWRDKCVVLVTYGGHGGSRCAEQLKIVLEGGLHMQLVGEVGVVLPREFIRAEKRVGMEEEAAFLAEYEGAVDAAFAKLLDGLEGAEVAS